MDFPPCPLQTSHWNFRKSVFLKGALKSRMRGYSLPPANRTVLSAWSSNRSDPARGGGRPGSHNGLSVAASLAHTESHWQPSNNLTRWRTFRGLHWPCHKFLFFFFFFPRIAMVIHPKWPRKFGDSSHIFVEHYARKHELKRASCRLEKGKTLSA